MPTYQVQSGYVFRGVVAGKTLEVDEVTPEIQEAIDKGMLGDPTPPVFKPNFVQLRASLDGSVLFARVYGLAKQHNSINAALTLVLDAISMQNLNNLNFGINELIEEMDGAGSPLTEGEATTFSQHLTFNHFPFTVTPEGVVKV